MSNDINVLNEKNKDNYITIKLNIEKNDIGKEISFLKQTLLNNTYIHNFEKNDIELIIDGFSAEKKYKFKNGLSTTDTACYISSKLNNSLYFYHIFKEEGFHTIKVIFNKKLCSCAGLFYDCCKIYEIDLSNFDDSQIESCGSMFYNCTNLHKINFGFLDFSLCTCFSYMFYQCKNLDKLDLYNFDTKNATTFEYMFYQCKNLQELDLLDFETKNATSFSHMFYGCTNLKEIDVSNFNTSSCKSIYNMFNGCENIKEINMIEWDMSKIKSFGEKQNSNGSEVLFKGCKKLALIKMNFNFNLQCHIRVSSEIPKDGTFIYKNEKSNNNVNWLLKLLPKTWKKTKE